MAIFEKWRAVIGQGQARVAAAIVALVGGIVFYVAYYSNSQKTYQEFLGNCKENYSDPQGITNCLQQYWLSYPYYLWLQCVALVAITMALVLLVSSWLLLVKRK